jgi:hypothetical protein
MAEAAPIDLRGLTGPFVLPTVVAGNAVAPVGSKKKVFGGLFNLNTVSWIPGNSKYQMGVRQNRGWVGSEGRRTCSPYPTVYNILRAWHIVRFKESRELGKEAARARCQIVSTPFGVPKDLHTIQG